MITIIVGAVLAVAGVFFYVRASRALVQSIAMLKAATAAYAETQELLRQVDETTARLIRESGGGRHG
jgi:hypothetical protein